MNCAYYLYVMLACWQMQNVDQQVQRALNMDNFNLANSLREDSQELDTLLSQLEVFLAYFSYFSTRH